MQKHLWKDYFSFSFRERVALLVLFCTTLVLLLLPRFFYPPATEPLSELTTTDKGEAAVLVSHAIETVAESPEVGEASLETTPHLFVFDPNTITEDGLRRLGIRPKTITTLLHYREKGGQFRKPDDLRKIYGLRKEEADQLVPYVNIASARRQTFAGSKAALVRQAVAVDETTLADPISYSGANAYGLSPGKQFLFTNINTATPDDWKRFPGIGEVLSRRIVSFRNKLGAFHSVSQVAQTYGLSDSVFKRMEPYLYLDTVGRRDVLAPGGLEMVTKPLQSSPGAMHHKKETPFPRGRLSWYVVLPLDGSPL